MPSAPVTSPFEPADEPAPEFTSPELPPSARPCYARSPVAPPRPPVTAPTSPVDRARRAGTDRRREPPPPEPPPPIRAVPPMTFEPVLVIGFVAFPVVCLIVFVAFGTVFLTVPVAFGTVCLTVPVHLLHDVGHRLRDLLHDRARWEPSAAPPSRAAWGPEP